MKKRGSVVLILVMFVSVVAAASAHVSLRLGVIRLGYQIGEQTKVRRQLEEENRQLRVEKSLLRSPDRIETLARDKLGMTRPDAAHIRVIRPGARELAQADTAGVRAQ